MIKMPGIHIFRGLLWRLGIIGLGALPCVSQQAFAKSAFYSHSNPIPSFKVVKERVI